jgi:hypothetical protein
MWTWLRGWFVRTPKARTLVVVRWATRIETKEQLEQRVRDWLDGKLPCLVLGRDDSIEIVNVTG